VGGADFGGGEDGVEGGSVAGGFDFFAPALFAVYEAEDAGDGHSGFAGGFDGGDGAASGGADVVDDDDAGAGLEETFDLAAGAVGLFGFADEKAVDEGGDWFGTFVAEFEFAGEFEDLVVVGEGPGAGAGSVGDERVGTHGEAAYGLDPVGIGDVLADEVVEDEAGETAAFGVEGSDAAVDVVVGLLAAGEGEVAELEGEGGDEMEEGGFVVRHYFVLRFPGGCPPYCPRVNDFESVICGESISAKYS
jgi:hypothetical protein